MVNFVRSGIFYEEIFILPEDFPEHEMLNDNKIFSVINQRVVSVHVIGYAFALAVKLSFAAFVQRHIKNSHLF